MKKAMGFMLAGVMLISGAGHAQIDWDNKRQQDNAGGKATPGEMEPGTVLMGALDMRGHRQAQGFSDRLITMATVYGVASDRHRENTIKSLYLNLDVRDLDGPIGHYVALKFRSHEEEMFTLDDDVLEFASTAKKLARTTRSADIKDDAEEIARRAKQCVKWIDKGRESLDEVTEQAVLVKTSMTKPEASFKFDHRLTVCQNALIYLPRVMSPMIPKGY